MATTADFKNGLCIKHNGDIWKIESFQHVKPGKGPAFVRTKIRNLNTGRVLENTFTSGFKIEIIRIENRSSQFLYKEGESYHFMDNNTFEQLTIQKDLINAPDYLKEGNKVEIVFYTDENRPISCNLPSNVILKVKSTEPGEKGNTATNALKPAILETGVKVNVPLFINEEDNIKLDTSNGQYLERVNS
tara:strand:- start:159 stop:725 length:567 start_codon:yes stop_codon:yes gene_type:complete